MKKTVMVVDDSPDIIYSVKNGLEEIGGEYEIIAAESGEKCLEYLNDNKIPDIIILDIMMPGISGWETYDKIKENEKWKNIPVVFLTARTDKIAENAGNFLGDGYIEKPFDLRDLKNRIDKLVKK